MNLRHRIPRGGRDGGGRDGGARARSVLTAAAALLVLSGSEEWIATPLPDGTTLYLRYGTPGGVRIHRGRPAEAARDSVALKARAGSAAAPQGAPAPSSEAWADSLAAQVRRILAEEIAALPLASPLTIELVRAPVARDSLVAPVLATPVQAAATPDSVAVPVPATPVEAAATPDSVATPVLATPAPVAPAIPPAEPAAPSEGPPAPSPPEPRTVREAFASDGLFTTQLLLFETGESDLLPLSRDILRVVAEVLREFPEARVRVEGYTDHRGRAETNLDLSRRRAEAVREFLAGEGGLGPDRVEAVGYGEEHPVIEGSTPTALALNRRVQIRVLNPEALRRSVEKR